MRRSLLLFVLLALGVAAAYGGQRVYDNCFTCGQYCTGCCEGGGGCLEAGGGCYIVCSPPPPQPGVCEPQDEPCGIAISQLPGDSITLSPEPSSLDDLLSKMSVASGVMIVAPEIGQRTLKLEAKNQKFGDVLGVLARQLAAVPVYRGSQNVIELVPRRSLPTRRFQDATRIDKQLTMDLRGMEIQRALRIIAGATGVDLVVPSSISGSVDGSFGTTSWQNLIETVLLQSGHPARVVVSANGLVRIIP